MLMKKCATIFAVPLFCLAALYGQTSSVSLEKASPPGADRPRALTMDTAIKTRVKGKPFSKVTCDDDGKLFLRLYIMEKAVDGTAFQVPIQKIKSDGSLGPSFKVTDAQADLSAADFVVSPTGDLFELAWSP